MNKIYKIVWSKAVGAYITQNQATPMRLSALIYT